MRKVRAHERTRDGQQMSHDGEGAKPGRRQTSALAVGGGDQDCGFISPVEVKGGGGLRSATMMQARRLARSWSDAGRIEDRR